MNAASWSAAAVICCTGVATTAQARCLNSPGGIREAVEQAEIVVVGRVAARTQFKGYTEVVVVEIEILLKGPAAKVVHLWRLSRYDAKIDGLSMGKSYLLALRPTRLRGDELQRYRGDSIADVVLWPCDDAFVEVLMRG